MTLSMTRFSPAGNPSCHAGSWNLCRSQFDTYHVTDEEMEQIVYETEMETRDRLRLGKRKPIDFDNDRHSEIWWEEMEKAVVRHGVPYYEAE